MNIKTIKIILCALTLFSIFGASSIAAQKTSPDLLLRELYRLHDRDLKNNSDSILSGKSRKILDKYFDKRLADFIWKDLTAEREEVGVLDFDPFYNAQDFDVKNFSVGGAKINGTKATVVIKFTNSGRKDILSYQFARQNSVWKITDIKYIDGSSLLGYFKEDAKR